MSKGEELLNKCFNMFSGFNIFSIETANDIFREYKNDGPYMFCKKYKLLHNNSAEEFSIAWMTWWNNNSFHSHY